MHRFVSLLSITLLLASSVVCAQDNGGSDISVYEVDADGSDIRILVHRAGAFSWLGHSHVISVGQLTGTIYMHPEFERSRFELEIPVHDLIVDDPILRRDEGDEFSSKLSKQDIARTRSNMLGKRVLNARQYPTVKLTVTVTSGVGPEFMLGLTIEIFGRVVELRVPLVLQLDEDVLEATGAFQLSHSALGMRPFSAILGALRVADEINFKYRIRAQRIQVDD